MKLSNIIELIKSAQSNMKNPSMIDYAVEQLDIALIELRKLNENH